MTTAHAPRSIPASAVFDDYETLVDSFVTSLWAANRSAQTVRTYRAGLSSFGKFLTEKGMPRNVAGLAREHVETFLAEQLQGHAPATCRLWHAALALFFRWAVEEGEVRTSPMAHIPPPHVPEVPVPVPAEEQLKALLKACAGNDFLDRRDAAILTLLMDCGLRRAELAALKVADVDLKERIAYVASGKGGRPRVAPFGRKAALALDRYLRVRTRRPDAGSPYLWLGGKGAIVGETVRTMLHRRCEQAGIPALHPHQLRHAWAHMMLADGVQEESVMRLAGWRSRSMLGRYAAARADERAKEAHRMHSPGDRL